MADGKRVCHDRDNARLWHCGDQHHDRLRIRLAGLQKAEEADPTPAVGA